MVLKHSPREEQLFTREISNPGLVDTRTHKSDRQRVVCAIRDQQGLRIADGIGRLENNLHRASLLRIERRRAVVGLGEDPVRGGYADARDVHRPGAIADHGHTQRAATVARQHAGEGQAGRRDREGVRRTVSGKADHLLRTARGIVVQCDGSVPGSRGRGCESDGNRARLARIKRAHAVVGLSVVPALGDAGDGSGMQARVRHGYGLRRARYANVLEAEVQALSLIHI